MTELVPIRLQELFSLPKLGIIPSSIQIGSVTMESDKSIVVRETVGGSVQVVVIDVANPSDLLRHSIGAADSALMNPAFKRILALKSGKYIQIFDLDQKVKLKAHVATEDITFWRWINLETIGIITENSLYHWLLTDDAPPVKVFERHSTLAQTRIISYQANAECKFLLLSGIAEKDNRVVGQMQLYIMDSEISKPIKAHAACFVQFKVEGNPRPSNLFCFSRRNSRGTWKLDIVEVSAGNQPFPNQKYVRYSSDSPTDFPISLHVGKCIGEVIYMATEFGHVFIFDVETGLPIYTVRMSGSLSFFLTAEHTSTYGLLGVNRVGEVISVSLDDANIIAYVTQKLQNPDLALKLAARCNLPGAGEQFVRKFNLLVGNGNYAEAAKVAATAPQGILRTPRTLDKLKNAPVQVNSISPLLVYFNGLLEQGTLNKYESIELCHPALVQGRKSLVEKWVGEEKLDCSEAPSNRAFHEISESEQLGDLVKPYDLNLALSIYLRGNVPLQVCQCFAESGQFDKIIPYAKKVNFEPDFYVFLLKQVIRTNPNNAATFAKMLVIEGDNGEPLADINQICDCFFEANAMQQCKAFLLEALKGDKESQGHLQTRLLEIILHSSPTQVADAMLANRMFSHYDRAKVGMLCQSVGLWERALEHFTDLNDIKRAVIDTQNFSEEWLVNYFVRLNVQDSIECLRAMMQTNIRQNLKVVVQIASKCWEKLSTSTLIELFESFKCYEGLFLFLISIVNFSRDPEVHYKYIQAATRTGRFKEVERICRESNCYDPESVKDYLKEAKLPDQLPLIIVCDKHNMVRDLIPYLYRNGHQKSIEEYVRKVNPKRLPIVVGALLKVDCSEDVIKGLIASTPAEFDIDELVDEVERSDRPKFLASINEEDILQPALISISPQPEGVHVQANTLSSLRSLLEFLETQKIPYSNVNIGPVHRLDVETASAMLDRHPEFACILAFAVPVDKDVQLFANEKGVRIFKADIIYHLESSFLKYRNELRLKRRKENEHLAIFPCKLQILPQRMFNSSNPIVCGVRVVAGTVKKGSPISAHTKEGCVFLGSVSSIERNHEQVESAKAGDEVCIKIGNTTGDALKIYGRHFTHTDPLISKISRESIDVCQAHFSEDFSEADWQLVIQLKHWLGIV